MKKLIIIIFISLLFFLSASSVMAENAAGASALLVRESFIKQSEVDELKQRQIKMVIENVLKRYNSPMAGDADAFVKTCVKYQIDCYLLPSIAGLESTFGEFTWPNSHNPFGWDRGFMMFNSWSDAIDTVGRGLRKGYMNKGALTVDEIGPIYSESPTWAIRVNYFVTQFENQEKKMLLLSNQIPVQL